MQRLAQYNTGQTVFCSCLSWGLSVKMLAIRQFSKLPVWVVENHNEVLEPIYRAIATRHLPFEGIAMLHFDSHPDLQIDTNMSADTVFDKQQLLNDLSIENWIMPAIYAGHIGHVTWVKPPWADQLPEGSRKVSVGRDGSSGKLRVNWPDSYFLSDLLYAPEEDLENGKDAVINVVTMETNCLRTRDLSTSTSACSPSRCERFLENDNHDLRGKEAGTAEACIETQGRMSLESEKCASNADGTFSESERGASDVDGTFLESKRSASNAARDQNTVESSRDTQSTGEVPCLRSASGTNQGKTREGLSSSEKQCYTSTLKSKSCTLEDDQDLKDGDRTCPPQKLCSSMDQKGCHKCTDDVANLQDRDIEQVMERSGDASLQCKSRVDLPHDMCTVACHSVKCNSSGSFTICKCCNSSVANIRRGDGSQWEQGSLSATDDSVVQSFSDFNGRFILDIDLDFFSTRNPFKQMYSKEQYRLMDELYRFAAPVDESAQALKDCQMRRARQISELSAGLKAAFNGDENEAPLEDKEIFLKVIELVRSLQSTPEIEEECLDPEMVHMAGLTCDDHGELPHHVSSDKEIDSLITTMEELLGKMPVPTMVTISRSSHDDYCPAHQVDGIQHRVLKMLNSLYDKLDIHLEYETP